MDTARGRPLTIGWKEYVAFPEWEVGQVKAKIDTGARTSAVDVSSFELRPAEDGILIAELRLTLDHRHPDRLTVVHTPVLEVITVTNSSGVGEQRPLVETEIVLGQVRKRVRLTVTNRAPMLFPMILGRKALEHDFVVDVSRKYLLGRPTRR